jgi:phage head maturation protease
MKSETQSLFTELTYYLEVFNNESEDIGPFIEQSKAFRKLKDQSNSQQSISKRTENLEAICSFFN